MKLGALPSGATDWQPTGNVDRHTEADPFAQWTNAKPRVFHLAEYRSDRLRTTAWFQAKDME